MITCKGLPELPYANKLKLLAGGEGVFRQIHWVHYIEVPEYIDWLKGGELVIISGILENRRNEEIIRMVDRLYDKQVAGIVVNLSSTLTQVPEAVIREGDALSLPVYEMPALIRIVDLSQSICFAIFQEKRRETTYKNILMEVIYGKRITDKRIKALEREGFTSGDEWFAVVLKVRAAETDKKKKSFYIEDSQEAVLARIDTLVDDYFSGQTTPALHTFDEEQEILILPKAMFEGMELENWLKEILDYLKKNEPGVAITASVGTEFTDIRSIAESVENAQNLIRICKDSKEDVLILKNHTLEWVLMGVSNRSMLKRIAESTLGVLVQPAQEELLNTLRVYLRCGQSKKDASVELFVHVNTLNYRVQKIEKLLEVDLKNPDVIFSLELAVRIYDYLKIS